MLIYSNYLRHIKSLITRIGDLNDLRLLNAWQLQRRLERPDLEHVEEVGQEADNVLPDRGVHVGKVLDAQMANVERQNVDSAGKGRKPI